MAIYRFSAQIVRRSAGRSAVAAVAYRAAQRIEDERTGLAHDYRRRGGVVHTQVCAPPNAPDWMRDRRQLWNAVEKAEKRRDAQLSREIQLALPFELTDRQRIELVRGFVAEAFVARGMVADFAIHRPDRYSDNRNHHAHVMLTMRELTAGGFGKKDRSWNEPDLLAHWRERWQAHANRALERAGRAERIDHRTLEAQSLEREPEPKLGHVAAEMEAKGKPSERGDMRREVRERNARRAELIEQRNVIDLEIAREERQRREAQTHEAERREREDRQQRKRQEISTELLRFEAWARAQRRELAQRHADQAATLADFHAQQREQREAEIADAYGEGRAQEEAALRSIEDRLHRGGLFYRITGHARRDRAEAELHRRTLANIDQREQEQRGALHRRQEAQRSELEAQQRRDGRELAERIEDERDRRGLAPANDRDEQRRDTPRNLWQQIEQDRAQARGRGDDRERDREPD